jgi:hypothetical protein
VSAQKKNRRARRRLGVNAISEKSRNGMKDIEQTIREVDATMAMEGMPLSDADKEDMRMVLRGEVSLKEMRQRILNEYMPKRTVRERI